MNIDHMIGIHKLKLKITIDHGFFSIVSTMTEYIWNGFWAQFAFSNKRFVWLTHAALFEKRLACILIFVQFLFCFIFFFNFFVELFRHDLIVWAFFVHSFTPKSDLSNNCYLKLSSSSGRSAWFKLLVTHLSFNL